MDNTTLNPGTGGDIISTDDLGTVKVQRVKIQTGTDGTAADINSSNPLPVSFTGTHDINITNTVIPVSDNNTSLTVDGTVSISGTHAVTVTSGNIIASGPLTDNQLRDSPVDVRVTSIIPSVTIGNSSLTVAGTVAVNSLPNVTVSTMPNVTFTNSTIGVTNSALVKADTDNVKIVNDSSHPIPTSLSSLPSFSSTQTVHVDTMPNVTVSSLPHITVDTLPNVTVDTLPSITGSVSVSSLPNVTVAAMPHVTVDTLPNVTVTALPSITGAVTATTTNTTSTITNYPASGYLMVSNTAVPIQYACVNGSSTDNTLVSIISGKKIRIIGALFVAAGTVNMTLQSGTGGTALIGPIPLVANGGFILQEANHGHTETGQGVLLNMHLDAAVAVTGYVKYIAA